MVYSIDKLDGGIVSVAADRVEQKEVFEDYIINFYKGNFDPNAKDPNGHIYANFGDRLVASYYLSNICGIREVIGITEEDLERMFKEDVLTMNDKGEYEMPNDGNGDEHVEIIY